MWDFRVYLVEMPSGLVHDVSGLGAGTIALVLFFVVMAGMLGFGLGARSSHDYHRRARHNAARKAAKARWARVRGLA